MLRLVVGIVLAIAFCNARTGAFADERVLDAIALDVPVELDPVLVRFLTSPDAILIKILHDRSEKKLLANLGIRTDQNGVASGEFQRKKLAFHCAYEVRGERRHVFVYDPCRHVWPGTQPETIVICDASYKPLAWKEVGGSPFFEKAALVVRSGHVPVLRITRRHRHTIPNPERGIYSFSLANDSIEALTEVEWLYRDDAERAQYNRWREAIRERQENHRPSAVESSHPPP